jgi:hypothetical protein
MACSVRVSARNERFYNESLLQGLGGIEYLNYLHRLYFFNRKGAQAEQKGFKHYISTVGVKNNGFMPIESS